MLGMFQTNTPNDPPAAALTATATPSAATVRGRTNFSCARRATQRLDLLPALFQGCEIPAAALGADHPQPALPLVEREAPPDPEPRGATVAVQLAVAKRAGRVHEGET